MTVLARVSTFLKAQPYKRFCDGCIKASIGDPSLWTCSQDSKRSCRMVSIDAPLSARMLAPWTTRKCTVMRRFEHSVLYQPRHSPTEG